jgi:membrane associated rhomboid family serine protease
VQADDDPAAWWRRLPQRPVTAGLLALCVLAYAATLVGALLISADPWTTATSSLWSLEGSEPILIYLGALDLTRVWIDGEWWRVVTSGLLHGSLIHLVLNMLALGSIGDAVEQAWGSWRCLGLFLLTSIAGCLASLVWCEAQIVLGASAGVLGQAGALWIARRFGSDALRAALASISVFGLGVLILLCLVLGAVIPGIAQAGHLGGLAMGLLLGLLLARPWPRWLQALGSASVLALFATAIALGRAPTWRPQYHAFLGARAAAAKDTATATAHYESALALDPDNADLLNSIAYQYALDGIELDRAETYVLQALKLAPTNSNYLDTLAWIWCRDAKPTQALPLLRAALALSRDPNPEISDHVINCASGADDLSSVPRETIR